MVDWTVRKDLTTGNLKNVLFFGKIAITILKLIQNAKVGGVLKNFGYMLCYEMGTEIFKIKEEMTEKMKPKVGNPPVKKGGIPCSQYFLSHFFFNFAFWMSLGVVMAIF